MKTLTFMKENNKLLLKYEPYDGEINFVKKKIGEDGYVKLKQVFIFSQDEIYSKNDKGYVFIVAELEGNYYKLINSVLSVDTNFYIHKDVKINIKMFIATRNISIFGKIEQLHPEDNIYIGNDEKANIPLEEFLQLINSFPTTYELNKYANARISTILREYIPLKNDDEKSYQSYMNKKISYTGQSLKNTFDEFERQKYKIILKKLKDMLTKESEYKEAQWQKEILEIILLVFPKYIRVYEEVSIHDVYSETNKRLDYLLITVNGNIDLVEIKQPFSNKNLLSKVQYRGNYVPLKELAGTIMQIEKYIYNLNKWGIRGEHELTKKFKDDLPNGLKLQIINPQGIVIMGRDSQLNQNEKKDFEIIKRQYKNIVDILTYDDLILRIERLIDKFVCKQQ
jgi:hypothetical protein